MASIRHRALGREPRNRLPRSWISGPRPPGQHLSAPIRKAAEMAIDISVHMDELAELCETYGVRRLEVFGSALRSDFDPKQSDIDFLVGFSEVHPLGAFERYFGLKEALERLFHRSVDLIEERAIRNPYFREAIERDRVLLYGTGR